MENRKYYEDNAASIFMYKSNRKNSQCEYFNIWHLISKNENKKINDDSILNQLCSTIDHVLYFAKKYNNKLIFKAFITTGKNATYTDVNNKPYNHIERNKYTLKEECFSFEEAINYIYNIYCLIYPYNTLSKNTIYNNSSIKNFINEYYKKGEQNEK